MLSEYPYQISLLAVLISSLLGSVHCVAMCGGFVSMVHTPGVAVRTQVLYHLGRLTTYILLGALFGAVGNTLDQSALRFGVENIAAVLVGGYLIITGVRGLSGSVSSAPAAIPAPVAQFFALVIRGEKLSAQQRAYCIGLFTTFLPCGWLYTFAAIAALSGGAQAGMLIMTSFWIGTVPVLALFGETGRRVANIGWRIAPRVTYGIITAIGLVTIGIHFLPHSHEHSHGEHTTHSENSSHHSH